MKPLAFVRYAAAAALVESLDLSPQAELAARRLRDWIWANQRAPAARPSLLASIARAPAGRWPAIDRELRAAGWHTSRGRYSSPAAMAVLREAQSLRRIAIETGARGAALRWASRQAIGAPCEPAWGPHRDPIGPPQQLNDKVQFNKQSVKLVERLAVERSAAVSARLRERSTELRGEAAFLREVAALCESWRKGSAKKELANWGGWWRSRFREDPDNCRAILADIASMLREGRLAGPPGPACYDLWQRLPTRPRAHEAS